MHLLDEWSDIWMYSNVPLITETQRQQMWTTFWTPETARLHYILDRFVPYLGTPIHPVAKQKCLALVQRSWMASLNMSWEIRNSTSQPQSLPLKKIDGSHVSHSLARWCGTHLWLLAYRDYSTPSTLMWPLAPWMSYRPLWTEAQLCALPGLQCYCPAECFALSL